MRARWTSRVTTARGSTTAPRPDGDAAQDARAEADPRAFADRHRGRLERLLADRALDVVEDVVEVDDHGAVAELRARADRHAAVGDDRAALAEQASGAELDAAIRRDDDPRALADRQPSPRTSSAPGATWSCTPRADDAPPRAARSHAGAAARAGARAARQSRLRPPGRRQPAGARARAHGARGRERAPWRGPGRSARRGPSLARSDDGTTGASSARAARSANSSWPSAVGCTTSGSTSVQPPKSARSATVAP